MTEYSDEQRIALFIDYENIAIGVREARYRKFDVHLVLERLLDKGKLLVKKAYADWSRYNEAKRSFHEAAIELIEVPQKSVGGKNSADIRMVVDAMDMSFQKEHINCFVVASGDSDFSPLVSKLKENNKYVIGVGVKNSTSDLLMENCDEFIFYEDLVRGKERPLPALDTVGTKLQDQHYQFRVTIPVPYPAVSIQQSIDRLVRQAFDERHEGVAKERQAVALVEQAIEDAS